MKKKLYQVLPFLLIGCFVGYWVTVFILSMPTSRVKKAIIKQAPSFQVLFGGTWNFFTPPYPYNNRMYFITRDLTSPGVTDTVEVLEEIALNKQKSAPFNQRQFILDHQVNNMLSVLIRTVWRNKTKPGRAGTGNTDPTYVAKAVAAVEGDINYNNALATLTNYAKRFFRERGINYTNKELKILVVEKLTRPMKEVNNVHFPQKEIVVYESPYKPLGP